MTDAEINARVAALRGDTIAQDDDGWYIVGDDGHRWPPPDYCGDPAAWGGLLVWLAGEGRSPRLAYDRWDGDKDEWYALVYSSADPETCVPYEAFDALPGRALAIAALRAYGVEVPQ